MKFFSCKHSQRAHSENKLAHFLATLIFSVNILHFVCDRVCRELFHSHALLASLLPSAICKGMFRAGLYVNNFPLERAREINKSQPDVTKTLNYTVNNCMQIGFSVFEKRLSSTRCVFEFRRQFLHVY